MRQEREAFRAAIDRDTSEFLNDESRDVDEEALEAELDELEYELEDELGNDGYEETVE